MLYHTVYELHLNKCPCHLFTSVRFSALDKRTHVTPAFSCSPLLTAPPAANSHSLCNNTAGDAQRRTRQSISPLRPAPMMFLKNILIDTAIKRDKSKRRSSGTSVWRVCYFPGQVYPDITDVWLVFEPENWLQRFAEEKSEIKWCASLLRGQKVFKKSLAHLLHIVHVLGSCRPDFLLINLCILHGHIQQFQSWHGY